MRRIASAAAVAVAILGLGSARAQADTPTPRRAVGRRPPPSPSGSRRGRPPATGSTATGPPPALRARPRRRPQPVRELNGERHAGVPVRGEQRQVHKVASSSLPEMALAGCHCTAHAGEVTTATSPTTPPAPTARSTVRRGAGRARTDRADLYAVLDAGLVCHSAWSSVTYRCAAHRYGRNGDILYLHGSRVCHARARTAARVCVTVTHLDGVVYARPVFHHSMNYRCAVVHGRGRRVTDDAERLAALRAVTEQLSPGPWDHARPPTQGNRRHLGARARPGRGEGQGPHRASRGRGRRRRLGRPLGRRRPDPHRRRRPAALHPAPAGHPHPAPRAGPLAWESARTSARVGTE